MRYNPFHALTRLAGAAALAAACVLPASAQQYVALPQSVIVFPFDKPENVDQSVADTVTTGIRNRMARVSGYEATTFNPKSPLIRRAVSAGELTQTQLTGPFDAASAAAVATAAGVDNALVGSVESVSNDGGTAKVSISVQLVSARGGEVQKTAGVTGSAAQAGLAADAQLRAAADDAAAKAIVQIFGPTGNAAAGAAQNGTTPAEPNANATGAAATDTQPNANATGAPSGSQLNIPTVGSTLPTGSIPTETKRKKSVNAGIVIGGLALLGLIIAASSGGGGGNGGGGGGNNGGGGPPVFPF